MDASKLTNDWTLNTRGQLHQRVVQAQTVFAPFRTAPLPLYLAASARLLALVHTYTQRSVAGFAARAAWLQAESVPAPPAALEAAGARLSTMTQLTAAFAPAIDAALVLTDEEEEAGSFAEAAGCEELWDEDIAAAARQFFTTEEPPP